MMPIKRQEDDEDEGPEWAKDLRFAGVIRTIRNSMSESLQDLCDETDCFGLYNMPGEGICPDNLGCQLAMFCRQVWNLVQIQGAESSVLVKMVPDALDLESQDKFIEQAESAQPATNIPLTADLPDERVMATAIIQPREETKRRKERLLKISLSKDPNAIHKPRPALAYVDRGRDSDKMLVSFLSVFPTTYRLPFGWQIKDIKKYAEEHGKYMISAASSFHALRKEAHIIVRFWTSTTLSAPIDIHDDLRAPLTQLSEKLGTFEREWYYKKETCLHLDPPTRIPASCSTKCAPCEWRVTARSEAAAKSVALVVRKLWNF